MRRHLVGVIGASRPTAEGYSLAHDVGAALAAAGVTVVCGGLGGVMEAVSRGCFEAGGEVLGILPGPDANDANAYVTLAVPTNMGHARNVIIAHTAEALIAIEGEYGTVSEMAVALKLGRPVCVLRPVHPLAGAVVAESAQQAVDFAVGQLSQGGE